MVAVENRSPVLLTGATGFVGHALYPMLERHGFDVVCASRNPEKARQHYPERRWVHLDVKDPASIHKALQGCRSAVYLIHSMTDSKDFEAEESRSAMNFLDAASAHGVERIVYLGGLKPEGAVSAHLRSRLVTGAVLRGGDVSTIELRASMIIGRESESWKMLRDIAVRLPVMIIPRWLRHRTQPVAIDDVTQALVGALLMERADSAYFDIPGPEAMTFQECIRRVAQAVGHNPLMIPIPLLTPHLSSYWLRFVSGADYHVARQLVEGLRSDLLAEDDRFWGLIDHEELVPFDVAVSRALDADTTPANRYEKVVRSLYRSDP